MAKITYTDKVDSVINALPEINKVVASDLNEIKNSVNTLYDEKYDASNPDGFITLADVDIAGVTGLQDALDEKYDASNPDGFITLAEVPSQSPEYVVVATKSDFPSPVDGVITLLANTCYFIISSVDLLGDRLIASANTTILGTSSETSILTSTGIGESVPLLYSDYTMPIRHITFKDVFSAVEINIGGQGAQPIALDWTGVNFIGCINNLVCGDIDNFIFSKGAVLGSGKFSFLGAAGTIGIDNSIFTGDGQDYSIIEVGASSVITRRLRIIYTSFVAFGSTKAILVNSSATIPVDSYILDTCNFSGGGQYLSGIGQFFTDNETRFVQCKGIPNTSAVGNYFMRENPTATTFIAEDTPTKILGTTSPNTINQKFTHTDNRLTYTGDLVKDFEIQTVCTFVCASSNETIGLYVAKNGVVIGDSEMYTRSDSRNRAEGISIQAITSLQKNDYIEIWIENVESDTNVTVEFLNVITRALN